MNSELKLITLTEATDTSRRWAAWKPWAVVAAGGAVAAAGGALHGHALRTFNAYDRKFQGLEDCAQGEHPPGCPEDDPRLPDLGFARREQAIAVGGYVVGGSLIAAGVVLLSLNRPRLTEQRASSSPGRRVEVVPVTSADMLGISVSVRR